MNIKSLLLLGLAVSLCLFAVPVSHGAEPVTAKVEPVIPTEVIPLLNGRDLSCFYTWLMDAGYEDPRRIFVVQPDGILRISGDGFGGLITHHEYANYHLVMEYRWGTATWLTRKDRARDGGLLLHCQGVDGGFGGKDGQPGPWMTSIECQIIEGGVGDILVLSGKNAKGELIPASATCCITRDRDGEAVWTPGAPPQVFPRGRINWSGRDPDWKDVVGIRGKNDVETPGEGWTTLECFCFGGEIAYKVNGVIVNRASDVQPNHGKILLQTEAAEMYVRRLELRPLKEMIP
ncbi:3-keto-disaccharide hydrolase [Planctomicrobium piriforme]|uniref:3-keto-alpha-glucoside-1,2-lyase/3-keto-2-hydroxy-glucal hydratase domain-containing protein n=1 Tax=Planctomicrobium piriforme TaxID=1576369 RepID=A0A1I3H113_9PLAN|nr:DUF1080 domain-containing protein [Planctomicrobium piriforme]SFI29404.1 protein of unknown function [Planctomicrobium piriforme]